MALTLEKIFLQKVSQMPQEEVEVLPQAAKGKSKKSNTSGGKLKKRTGFRLRMDKNSETFIYLLIHVRVAGVHPGWVASLSHG